ncbi:carbohydrate ABC transporter permease [Geochorda subterranea]|uniref:Sugar ABC transporter permease n=1 Tax=Geochorda subterranea TaxID=3109564 RepID=A0ABZ1BRI6_9FIRM|nr:sugar ABC transporter permease [Limnochorda sp. LNt]WRP15125.1 sugar ABC transporter permease [Limnochorda sp. LNt]
MALGTYWGAVLQLPALLVAALLVAWPVAWVVYLSFRDMYLLRSFYESTFVGLRNYARLAASPDFRSFVWHTGLWVVGTVAGELAVGMAAALLLNRPGRLVGVCRGVLLIPWVVPPVVAAVVWRWLLDGQWGVINRLLLATGIVRAPVLWLGDPVAVWPTLIAVTVWKAFPFAFVNFLAALQGIPSEVVEAAQVDGATPVQVLRHITLPLVYPVVKVVTLLLVIWRSNEFNMIWVMTQGGPGNVTMTLAPAIYSMAFQFYRVSLACAAGVALMLVLLLLVGSYVRQVRGEG